MSHEYTIPSHDHAFHVVFGGNILAWGKDCVSRQNGICTMVRTNGSVQRNP